MYQLTQLAADRHRQRLAHAEQQRPVERLLALRRATRRAERAEWRMRRTARQLRRLGAQPTPLAVVPPLVRQDSEATNALETAQP